MKSIVILISGRGSNMRAIIEANLPNIHVKAVISNQADSVGLLFAQQQGIVTHVLPHKSYKERKAFDDALSVLIDDYQPDYIILAGFMRVLGEDFVRHFSGKILNIHPALLPMFPGLHTHQRALDMGIRIHGATVHFVSAQLDAGPIICQGAVPVLRDDTEASLAQRVLQVEHQLYPKVLTWIANDQLKLEGDKVILSHMENTNCECLLVP